MTGPRSSLGEFIPSLPGGAPPLRLRRFPFAPPGIHRLLATGFFLLAGGCAMGTGAPAPTEAPPAARTIQPSAPGEPTRVLSFEDVATAVHPSHTRADVLFMQGMLHHHAQAMVMTGLAATHTVSQDIRLLARRIELSQDDEIVLMARWLEERGEEVPELVLRFEDMVAGAEDHAGMDHGAMDHGAMDPAAHASHAAHGTQQVQGAQGGHEGHADGDLPMHGMLTDAELMELASSRDRAFDRLFLQFMIRHHEGAVQMVNDLFASPGGGQEEDIFQFASHVEGDQNIEIRRMQGMLSARR